MAIAVGATSKGHSTSSSALATTGVTTQASGSVFVAAVIFGATATFTSIVDSKSNTYTQIGTEISNGSTGANYKARLYYVENGTGGSSHTATVNLNTAEVVTILFAEITGALTSGALDQSDGRRDTTSPFGLAAGLTTVQANELLLSFLGGVSGNNPATHAETCLGSSTIQSGAEETDGSQFWTGAIATAIKSSTGTFNPSWTESGNTTDSVVFLATFKAAASGGTTTQKTMTDTLTTSDAALDPTYRVRQMSDTVVVTDETPFWRRLKRVMDETLTISDSFVKNVVLAGNTIYTKVMSDTLSLADFAVQWLRRVRDQIDTTILSDGDTYRFSVVTASESLDVSDGFVSWRRLKRIAQDNLDIIDGFSKTLVGAGIIYAKVMSDVVILVDDAGQRWKLRVSRLTDSIGLSDQVLDYLRAVRSLGDVVELSDGTVKVRRYTRSMDDSFEVSDERVSTLYLDQISNTAFSFGASGPPFRFGGM